LKDLSFGLTMTFWGMGVTLFTLGLLILIIHLMNRLYPFKKEMRMIKRTSTFATKMKKRIITKYV